jgi:SAM-dependent methyltransferase
MSTTATHCYERHGCSVVPLEPERLLDLYERAGFLYEDKKRWLTPFLRSIAASWRTSLVDESLHRVLTVRDEHGDVVAGLSSWRTTVHGMSSQHLFSLGGPLGSRAVLLGEQARLIHDPTVRSAQGWFRNENRFPKRVVGSIVDSLGPDHAAVGTFDLVAVPRDTSPDPGIRALPCDEAQPELFDLAVQARGAVYARAEELDADDLLLEELDERYRHVGLRRYRRVWLATIPGSDRPCGAAVAYRGPLGLNLSFLENRCDLLIGPELEPGLAGRVAVALAAAATAAYDDFPPRWLPVTCDAGVTPALRAIGGQPIRQYARSTWLEPSFAAWYEHVASFYERVARADRRRGLASGANGRALGALAAPAKPAPAPRPRYLLDDEREPARLAAKVDAPAWVEKYLAGHVFPGTRILDVGCGPATIDAELARRYPAAEVVAADLCDHALRAASDRLQGLANANVVRAEATSLPLADNSFDIVLCRFVMEYLPDRDAALREMIRVARPGGLLLLQDLDGQLLWHHPIDEQLVAELDRVIAALAGTGFDPYVGRKLYHLAHRAGLSSIEVEAEPYHLIAGRIDSERRRQWQLKLDLARPVVSSCLGPARARRFLRRFLEHLDDESTLTYSQLFTLRARAA